VEKRKRKTLQNSSQLRHHGTSRDLGYCGFNRS